MEEQAATWNQEPPLEEHPAQAPQGTVYDDCCFFFEQGWRLLGSVEVKEEVKHSEVA